MTKDLTYYLQLNYPVKLTPISEEDGGGWLAEIPLLPGCMSDGETPEEALENVREAKEAWLKVALQRGQVVPEPQFDTDEQYSGKFTLRLPKSLHRRLAHAAQEENVSLNQYVLALISYGFGVKSAGQSRAEKHTSFYIYVNQPANDNYWRTFTSEISENIAASWRRAWRGEGDGTC